MQSIPRPRPDRHTGRLLWGTLAGACLVAFGLGLAYLVIGTPLVARLAAGRPGWTEPDHVGAARLGTRAGGRRRAARGRDEPSGPHRRVRPRRTRRPVAGHARRWAHSLTTSWSRPVSSRATAGRSRSSSSGHSGSPSSTISKAATDFVTTGASWETRTRDGWVPTEHPLDRVARDAERVRHWLTHGDLDYVVRVYAALVTPDTTIQRTPSCAVISDDQIPDWLAALPRQRSFSAGAAEPPAGTDPRGRGHRGAAARLVGEPGLEPGTSGI